MTALELKLQAAARSALLFLAACLAATSAGAQTVVRVGNVNTVSDIGIYIADKKGYFEAEGLTVQMTPFTTAAQMVAPLGAGQLDVGGGTISAGLYNANARAIGILIVADKGSTKPGYTFSSLMIRKDHIDSGRFKTLKDLKGMKIATAGPGTGNVATLNAALEKAGLQFADVEVVALGFPQHVVAYANKAIDAGITNEPSASVAIRQGVAVRAPGDDDIYPYHQTAGLLYSAAFAKSQPDAALKFMRAYIKGARDYNDSLKDGRISGPNAEEVIAILREYTAVKDEKLLRETTPSAVDPDGKVLIDSLRRDFAFFKRQKWIEKDDITVEAVVDTSFARKAVEQLGAYKPKS